MPDLKTSETTITARSQGQAAWRVIMSGMLLTIGGLGTWNLTTTLSTAKTADRLEMSTQVQQAEIKRVEKEAKEREQALKSDSHERDAQSDSVQSKQGELIVNHEHRLTVIEQQLDEVLRRNRQREENKP